MIASVDENILVSLAERRTRTATFGIDVKQQLHLATTALQLLRPYPLHLSADTIATRCLGQ